MKIGVISDTHGYLDPQLAEVLAGVDAILHAGDVGSEEVLRDLEGLAKVYAVRGNVDSADMNLPPSLSASLITCRLKSSISWRCRNRNWKTGRTAPCFQG